MTLPFYPFYWGDYSSKTFNLTNTQHGIYILLLRHFYCTGERIADNLKYSIAKAINENERLDVDYILANYFHKKNGVWFNQRAEEIVRQQHEIHEANVIKGKKGGRPPKPQLNPNLTPVKVGPKQPEPEPIIRKKEPTVLSKEKRGTRIPDNFEPDENCHKLAEALLLTNRDCQDALDNFMDYWRGVPGAKGVKLDWQATFRNQLRHTAKGKRNGKNNPNSIKGGFDVIDAAVEQLRQRESDIRNGNGEANSQDVPRLRQVNA